MIPGLAQAQNVVSESAFIERQRRLDKARRDIARRSGMDRSEMVRAEQGTAVALRLMKGGLDAPRADLEVAVASHLTEMCQRFREARATPFGRFVTMSDIQGLAQEIRGFSRDGHLGFIGQIAESLVDLLRQIDSDNEFHLTIVGLHIDAMRAIARRQCRAVTELEVVSALRELVLSRIYRKPSRRSA